MNHSAPHRRFASTAVTSSPIRPTQRLRAALLSGLDTDGDPRELLRLLIETYLTFIEEEPELYRFVVRRSFADQPVRRDPGTTNAELISGALTTIFEDRLRSLGMDSGGAETWAHAGVGMVQSAGTGGSSIAPCLGSGCATTC
jgi:tetracycline repressor-like protein